MPNQFELRPLIAGALMAAATVAFLPTEAQASCTVPGDLAHLTAVPNGCQLIPIGGPATFSNVLDGLGHLHDITLNSLVVTPGVGMSLGGTNFNQFSSITSPFFFNTNNSTEVDTDPGLNTFSFGVWDQFSLTTLTIASPGMGPGLLPPNWVVALDPSRLSEGKSMAIDNGNGTYTISSFFDVFTELSLDFGTNFTPQSGQAPFSLQLVPDESLPAPEPASIALFGAALAGLGFVRRRKAA